MKAADSKWAYLIILSIIWGSSFILIKKSLLGLSPYQMGALRVIITGIILFLPGIRHLRAITLKQWKWIGVSGFLGSFFPSFLFAFAETEIDSAVASIMNSLVPLNTILMGFAVFKIASSRRQIIGVVIGFIGTALLILKGAHLNPDQNYLYAGFVIVATIMYAANVNIIKKHLQLVSPLSIAAGNYVVIIIPGIIVLLFSDFFSPGTFDNPEFKMSLVYVIILSFFGTALAKVLFNKLVHMATFGLWQALATAIILIGVYLSHRKQL
jgi:drug/metabolite transporter (DMT)-like permease